MTICGTINKKNITNFSFKAPSSPLVLQTVNAIPSPHSLPPSPKVTIINVKPNPYQYYSAETLTS